MIAPPAPPPHDELEALIREARARQRRRRTAAGVLTVAAAAVLATHGILRLGPAAPSVVHRPGGPVGVRTFRGHGRLAYLSRGVLWLLDGVAGRRVELAPARERPSQAAFSGDGRWLAYALGTRRVEVARADGSARHVLPGDGVAWLPGDRLLAGRNIYAIGEGVIGPGRVGAAPSGLVAWAPDGGRYVFLVNRIVHGRNRALHGVTRLQVADSLAGPRTTWYTVRDAFTRRSGWRTPGIGEVVVLPQRRGLVFWLDPMHSASMAADGESVYEIRRPGARPRRLGTTVGGTVSVGRGGKLALGAGSDRYAWVHKTVLTCAAATVRCRVAPAPGARLTLEPAWSPDGRTLAFVEASPEPEGDFRQATILRWYATRLLYLLRASAHHAVSVPGTVGAAAPEWSRDGRSLLFVRGDALWLIPRLGVRPLKVSGPLLPPHAWGSYYGEITWTTQFAWWS